MSYPEPSVDLVREHLAYYRADHGTRTDCPVCGRPTYGPMNTYSPSGWKGHDPECPIPRRCRCGGPKATGFAVCRACERAERLERAVEREREWGIEDRERVILSGGPQVATCYVCDQPGTEANPLGLYGTNKVTSHYECVPFEESA